jgi:hypothetical protein
LPPYTTRERGKKRRREEGKEKRRNEEEPTSPSELTEEEEDAGLPPLHHGSTLHAHRSSLLQLTTAPSPSHHEPKVIHASPYPPTYHAHHRAHTGVGIN